MEESSPGGFRATREPKSAVLSREMNGEVEGLADGGIWSRRLQSSQGV